MAWPMRCELSIILYIQYINEAIRQFNRPCDIALRENLKKRLEENKIKQLEKCFGDKNE